MLTDIRALADHFLIALPNINSELAFSFSARLCAWFSYWRLETPSSHASVSSAAAPMATTAPEQGASRPARRCPPWSESPSSV